ncbi:MAM domain-containing protein 2-like [Oncorhynchus tshawytscha]|uniref:MAM domain-containing protein 2-like n=1 Tax=Oncorhynchus tshawytscha TaxID=74940 RepID=UPI000D0A5BA1|nr:MAM domain-containing protein 2-like [Oncorhynchus tshawytscha]
MLPMWCLSAHVRTSDCGSVALDDISVSLGDCDLTAGLLLSVPGLCNFETGHCGYIQDKEGDKGDWVLVRGPTSTSYTGPRVDHTTGVGYYMPGVLCACVSSTTCMARA